MRRGNGKAANEGNSAAIRRSHAALSDLYASVAAAIRSALPEAETYAESGTGVLEFAPAEDDVMELLPDDP